MFFVSFLYYLLSTNSLISLSFYALLKASKKKLRYCSVRFLSSPAATEHWSEATTVHRIKNNRNCKKIKILLHFLVQEQQRELDFYLQKQSLALLLTNLLQNQQYHHQ